MKKTNSTLTIIIAMLLILLVTTTPAFAESKSHPTYTDSKLLN